MRLKSINSKIIVMTGVCLLLLAVTLVVHTGISVRSSYLESEKKHLVSSTREQAALIAEKIDIALDSARTIAHMFSTFKREEGKAFQLTREQVNQMLKELLLRNPHYLGTYTLWEPNAFDGKDAEFAGQPGNDANGRFLPYWNRSADGKIVVEPLVEYDAKDSYYTIPKSTKKEAILDPYLYKVQGKDVLLTSLVVPIIVNDQFYGITGVDIALDFLQELADVVDMYDGTAQLQLISHKGNFAAFTKKPELAGKHMQETHEDWEDDFGYISRGEEIAEVDEGNMAVFTPVKLGETGTPWSVSIYVPMSKLTEKVRAMLFQKIGLGIFLTLLAMVILWYAARKISQPVKIMVERTRDLTEGDADLSKRINIRSGDELETLAGYFNNFIEHIQTIILKVKDNSHEILSSSEKVGDGSHDLAVRTNQQAASITETSTTLEEFTATLKQNSENSEEADSRITVFDQEVQDKRVLIDDVTATMTEINSSSKEINKVMNVINDISFQTNLLALNAAVEAARAGEAGRGFAVVASEVRNLAQKTAESAKTIKDIVSRNVDATNKGMQLVNETSEFFESILQMLHDLSTIVRDISTGSKEQSTGVEQINNAIAQLEDVINQNASLVEEFSSEGKRMNGYAKELTDLVEQFKTDSSEPARQSSTPAARPSASISRKPSTTASAPGAPKKKAEPKGERKAKPKASKADEDDFFASDEDGFEEF